MNNAVKFHHVFSDLKQCSFRLFWRVISQQEHQGW